MKNLIQYIKKLETVNLKNIKDKKFLLEKEKNLEDINGLLESIIHQIEDQFGSQGVKLRQ